MDLSIIRILSEKRVGGMKRLAADIGMSEANLHRCVNNNKIQAADLEHIAIQLQVDIQVFFNNAAGKCVSNTVSTKGDDSPACVNGSNVVDNNSPVLKERIKHLEELLAEKERLINVLLEGRK